MLAIAFGIMSSGIKLADMFTMLKSIATPFLSIFLSIMLSSLAFADLSSSGMAGELAVLDIDHASIANQETGRLAINIGGFFPNACYHWDHFELKNKTQYIHYAKAIAEVRPVICTQAEIEFSRTIVVTGLDSGTHKIIFINRTIPALEITAIIP
jgi:hypothetical protein